MIALILLCLLPADSTLTGCLPTPTPIVVDVPNDNGHALLITWDPSPSESIGLVSGYEIWRGESQTEPFELRGAVPPGLYKYKDRGDKDHDSANHLPSGKPYIYFIRTVAGNEQADSPRSSAVAATGQWYHKGKTPVLIGTLLFSTLALYFVRVAREGKKLYIRPLGGIAAVDEAIGRATEMGKPILYLLGSGSASGIATIASYAILGRVAKKTAEYRTRLMVPCKDPVVMTVAQETVKAAYAEAGQPDSYDEDSVFYITSMQFAFVAAVSGIMVREKPATNFYMGSFYAESLFLAETGSDAGSIQISGTEQVAQIPFFVVATDYTLIGEELFAASAYLGGDPLLLGTLKAQDYAKAILMIVLFVGALSVTLGWSWFAELFKVALQ